GRSPRQPGRCQAVPRALRAVCARRKSRRRGKPDRASGADDAWLGAARGARDARHRRYAGAALGRHRGCGRPDCRSCRGAGITAMSDGRASADTAGVVAPPPLIALATLVIGVAADWLLPLNVLASVLNWPARIGIGAVLLLAGGALVVVAERAFHRVGTNVPPWRPALALATGGLYAYMRNPMYVGAILILAGIAAALASDWMAIL